MTYYPDFGQFYDDILEWEEEYRCFSNCENAPSDNYINKDRRLMSLNNTAPTTPLEYAENPWLPDDGVRVRCDHVIIGYMHNRYNIVGIAPVGKDVHHFQMNAEQLDVYIALLQVYRKHMEDVTND